MLEPTKQEQHTTVSAKKRERESIEKHVAAYLKDGGKIKGLGGVNIDTRTSPVDVHRNNGLASY